MHLLNCKKYCEHLTGLTIQKGFSVPQFFSNVSRVSLRQVDVPKHLRRVVFRINNSPRGGIVRPVQVYGKRFIFQDSKSSSQTTSRTVFMFNTGKSFRMRIRTAVVACSFETILPVISCKTTQFDLFNHQNTNMYFWFWYFFQIFLRSPCTVCTCWKNCNSTSFYFL